MDCENIDSNNLEMESPVKKKRKTRSTRSVRSANLLSEISPETLPVKSGRKRKGKESLLQIPMATKHLKTSKESRDKISEIDNLAIRLEAKVTTKETTTAGKMETNVSQLNPSNKSQNFITTLQKVASQKYADIKSRLKIQTLPECCSNHVLCENIHKNSEVHMISSYEKEAFKINFKSGLWDEALIVCHHTLNKNHYLNTEVLLSIMEIIMNVHHDTHKDYSFQYILQGFEKIMERMLIIHPPCPELIIKNYRNFLTEPLVFESITSERKEHKPEQGLFKFILSRLEYELSSDSPDGPIIDAYVEKFNDNLNEVYLRKRKYEVYETHDRKERIARLFIVLDIVIELLEKDLAIWISKYIGYPNKHISGTKKPLAASLLWHNNTILTGIVTDNCRQVFKIYKNLVKLDFPHSSIKTFSRLVNIFSNTFYICDKNCNIEYPCIGNCCIILANEFYKMIEDEDVSTVISIIMKMETTFIQFLLTKNIIVSTTKSDHSDFILSINDIFKREIWNTFPGLNITAISYFGENKIKFKTKLHKFDEENYLKQIQQNASRQSTAIDELKKSLRKHDTDVFYCNTFPKMWEQRKLFNSTPVVLGHLKNYKSDHCRTSIIDLKKSDFIIVFYLSFKFFLELYHIADINKYYKINYEMNRKFEKKTKSDCFKDTECDTTVIHDKLKVSRVPELRLSTKYIKKYVLIFKTMKKIGETYGDLEKNGILPTNIFDNLNFFLQPENDVKEEEIPIPLTANIIREGVQLCRKLKNHFILHDANSERAFKFQRVLKNCISGYKELYKQLVNETKKSEQTLITNYIVRKRKSTQINDEIDIDSTTAHTISSEEGSDFEPYRKSQRKLS